MTTLDVPQPQVRYGRIVHRLTSFWADSPDVGDVPDETTHTGVVVLTPLQPVTRWPTTDPPRTATISTLECPVIDGDLYPPETDPDDLPDEPGASIVATYQPEGEPSTVQWRATYRLDGLRIQPPPLVFEAPAEGTLDLATVIPVPPAPGIVNVVTSEDRIRAEVAADAAALAAQMAGTSAGNAAEAASSASQAAAAANGSAVNANASAIAAGGSATQAQSAASTASNAATTATNAQASATLAANAATSAASSANGSATVASNAATTAGSASQAASSAAGTANAAATTASNAASTAQSAAQAANDAAAAVRGLRIFLVPHDQWPPAPDPNPLHWYVRVWETP